MGVLPSAPLSGLVPWNHQSQDLVLSITIIITIVIMLPLPQTHYLLILSFHICKIGIKSRLSVGVLRERSNRRDEGCRASSSNCQIRVCLQLPGGRGGICTTISQPAPKSFRMTGDLGEETPLLLFPTWETKPQNLKETGGPVICLFISEMGLSTITCLGTK